MDETLDTKTGTKALCLPRGVIGVPTFGIRFILLLLRQKPRKARSVNTYNPKRYIPTPPLPPVHPASLLIAPYFVPLACLPSRTCYQFQSLWWWASRLTRKAREPCGCWSGSTATSLRSRHTTKNNTKKKKVRGCGGGRAVTKKECKKTKKQKKISGGVGTLTVLAHIWYKQGHNKSINPEVTAVMTIILS